MAAVDWRDSPGASGIGTAAQGAPRSTIVVEAVGRNMAELEQGVLRALLILAAMVALPTWWQLANRDSIDIPLLADSVLAAALIYITNRLLRDHLPAAKVLFLATCCASIAVAAFVAGLSDAVYLFVLPVIGTAALFRRHAALALAVAAAALTWFAMPGQALIPVMVIVSAGLWQWSIFGPLEDLLLWSWQRSLDATVLSGRLQEQRGKLNRTIKDLDASYQLLRQSNRELAVARQEADSLRDLRSRFATNLSHEIRTPLNIILGFSQLIYLHPDLYGCAGWTEALRRDLAQIQRNASYLSELVDDIVDLARVDALAMPIRRQASDLPRVIEEAMGTVQGLARDKGLDIRILSSGDLPTLMIDPVRVRQVLFNLITNAIRYTEAGSISVTTEVGEDEVMVSVTDTGCGIAEAELTNIFNEFYQVARPKVNADVGKGLGLAIARRFVHLHGGRIWATSTVGRGSTFAFSLPIAAKSVSMLRPGTPAPVPGARQAVALVLNDDGGASAYLRRRFQDYDFAPAESPEDAVALLAETVPAAAIYNRPVGADGSERWQAVIAALPESVPLIDCSLPSANWLFSEEDFAAVLSKPVSPEAILGVLGGLLQGEETRSVLLVDDDRGFVQLLRRMLQAAGDGHSYSVASAYSGEEALRRLRRSRPDAVLVDLLMPGMSGFEMLQQMRREPDLAGIPVVAVTAATPGEDQMRVSGASFTVARQGVFRPGELLRLLETGLELATSGSLSRAERAEAS